ncbi:unnamed protein product [Moneuplotes crassus]|uniref:Uncharacterized protein n=1 Tax=Euplotes crassus TaxID=5936 RepID=A0AAD1UAF2_EUPCR|nr:unnamed protein product [Moneuplotes crassus]
MYWKIFTVEFWSRYLISLYWVFNNSCLILAVILNFKELYLNFVNGYFCISLLLFFWKFCLELYDQLESILEQAFQVLLLISLEQEGILFARGYF